MSWRANFRALLLALVAVGVVFALVFTLYQSMRADKTWREFVAVTTTETADATTVIKTAEESVEIAQNAGVDESGFAPLIDQIAVCRDLVGQLKRVENYAEDPRELTDKVGAAIGTQEESSLASLDLFAGLEAAGTNVVTPPRPYAVISKYQQVSDTLASELQILQRLTGEVDDAIEGRLGNLQDALTISEDSLVYEVARGRVLEQYAVGRAVAEKDLAPLRTALDNAQRLLVDQRGIDRESANQVAKALGEVNNAIDAVTTAASGLVDRLGVDAQQMLDELTPDQLWQEQATWVPIPAPLPEEVAPPAPVEPESPVTPQEPEGPATEPENPGGGGETTPGGGEGETGGGETGGGGDTNTGEGADLPQG